MSFLVTKSFKLFFNEKASKIKEIEDNTKGRFFSKNI